VGVVTSPPPDSVQRLSVYEFRVKVAFFMFFFLFPGRAGVADPYSVFGRLLF